MKEDAKGKGIGAEKAKKFLKACLAVGRPDDFTDNGGAHVHMSA